MKMNKLRYILAAVTLCLGLAACQNNGHIGYLFGTWRVDSFTIDGVPQPEAAARTLISFQSDIILVQEIIDDDGSFANHIGTWREEDGRIYLIFRTDEENLAFSPPAWLGWPADEEFSLAVSDRSSRQVTWTWTAPDGATYIYKLHKTW